MARILLRFSFTTGEKSSSLTRATATVRVLHLSRGLWSPSPVTIVKLDGSLPEGYARCIAGDVFLRLCRYLSFRSRLCT